jgi:L-threonylcarbamoyladenylate synthase
VGAVEVAAAIEALRAGEVVLLATDGVYGLCAEPASEPALRRLYALKGRSRSRPAAIIAASLETLLERIPELEGRSERIARALLPGPYTLVLPNPAGRYRSLGGRPDAIGVRVAALPPATQQVLDALGVVAATSANLTGAPDPARLEDVPAAIRAGCAVSIDGGRLGGTPSTVIDFTGGEPVVLRAGAGSADGALLRVAAALGGREPPGAPPPCAAAADD